MLQLIEDNWLLLLLALLIGIAIAWYIFHSSRKTRVTGTARDPLDDGAEPTKRNQALIDAPPVVVKDAQPGAVEPTPVAAENIQVATSAPAEETPPDPTPAPAAPINTKQEPQPAPTEATLDTDGVAGDDLARIKGVGPKLVAMLNDLGVTSFAQIAAWSASDIATIDAQLGRFQGRIMRDDWVGQAKLLLSGNTEDYEAKFGKTS